MPLRPSPKLADVKGVLCTVQSAELPSISAFGSAPFANESICECARRDRWRLKNFDLTPAIIFGALAESQSPWPGTRRSQPSTPSFAGLFSANNPNGESADCFARARLVAYLPSKAMVRSLIARDGRWVQSGTGSWKLMMRLNGDA